MTMILSETLLITPTIETGPISIKSSSTATTRTAGSVRRATPAVAVSAGRRTGARPAPGFLWLPIQVESLPLTRYSQRAIRARTS